MLRVVNLLGIHLDNQLACPRCSQLGNPVASQLGSPVASHLANLRVSLLANLPDSQLAYPRCNRAVSHHGVHQVSRLHSPASIQAVNLQVSQRNQLDNLHRIQALHRPVSLLETLQRSQQESRLHNHLVDLQCSQRDSQVECPRKLRSRPM